METLFTLRKLIDREGLFSVTVHVYSTSKQNPGIELVKFELQRPDD
jgi:hypothetical protein